MTLKEMRTLVRMGLGNPNQEQVPDAEIDHHINRAQIILNHDGGLLRKTTTASTINGRERYSMPSDLVSILRLDYDGKRLPFMNYDDILELDVT